MASLRSAENPSCSRENQGYFVFSGRVEHFADRVSRKNVVSVRTNAQSQSHRQAGRSGSDVGHQSPRSSFVSVASKTNCITRGHRLFASNAEASSTSTSRGGYGPSTTSYLQEDAGLHCQPTTIARISSTKLFT